MAGLVAPLEVEARYVTHEAAVFHSTELPLVARNGARLTEKAIADGQRIARALRIDWRIAGRVGITPQIIERIDWIGRIRREGRRHPPGDWFFLFDRWRRIKAHQVVTVRDVELPAHPHQRVALAHEEAVAEIRLCGRVEILWGAIEIANDVLAPAIKHVEQRNAIAERRVLRGEHIQI